MRIGVLALQGDFREHKETLQRLGADVVEVRLAKDLASIDGLIIPGGESTTMTRLLRQYGLMEPVRDRIKAGMPVLGTCAGAIVLAKEAGGLDQENLGLMDISVRRNAFGRQVDSFEAELRFPSIGPQPLNAIFIRAPIIEAVHPPAEVLATLEDGTIVAAKEGNMLALAFHPELTQDPRIHAYFLEMVESGAAAQASGPYLKKTEYKQCT